VPAGYSSPDIPTSAPPGNVAASGNQTGDQAGTQVGDQAGYQMGPLPQRRPSGAAASGLPMRTPMAQTPPLPSHIPPPDEGEFAESDLPRRIGTAGETEHGLPRRPVPGSMPGPGTDQPGQGDAGRTDNGLPRRPVTSPSERPPSMAAAAQSVTGNRAPSGITPPVIPGAGGRTAPADAPADPGETIRPATPPVASGPGAQTTDSPPPEDEDEFTPANDVERELLDAAEAGSTDRFLSTLLLATVLVPVAHNSRPGSAPGESGFAFRTEEADGERFLVVFTSRDRLSEHYSEPTRTVGVRFYELIRNWPDPDWSFAVNPESPVGATYPGPQVIALANWAADAGLGADPADADERPEPAPVPAPQKVSDSAQRATVMQKTIPPEHVDYYLERGYDRVAGFVHRANEVEHLRTPAELFAALGLVHEGSPFTGDTKEAYVLRWPAYRPSLYRIPYGGQSEQALRAMDGWVIERPPFRGNGFAPGEGRDVIAEFKVDSVRLPHGAQLWRMDADGTEKMVAIFDSDAPIWRRVGE
jgi:SseB protein N-terminal domain